MQDNVSIVIADDHSLIRQGLKQVIETGTNFHIHEAENGKQAYRLIKSEKPVLAVLDIEMPEMTGFEVAKAVKNDTLSTSLIFLTMFKDETMFNKAMDIGVKGYVLKENTVAEIVKCIHSVLKGNYYLSPAISEYLIRRNNSLSAPATDTEGLDLLTPAEIEILKLLADMKTNQEIAEKKNVSIKTVQNHRHNICNKLKISGTHALLKFAIEHQSKL